MNNGLLKAKVLNEVTINNPCLPWKSFVNEACSRLNDLAEMLKKKTDYIIVF